MRFPVFGYRPVNPAASDLEGVKSGDIPIYQPIQFEPVINVKIAKVVGVAAPQSPLQRTDEIILKRGLPSQRCGGPNMSP